MTEQINFSLSQLSLQSTGSAGEEDWDRSMQLQSEPELDRRTPRNSVVFPGNTDNSGEGDTGDAPGRTHGQSTGGGKPKRTLSELLRLHAANGPDGTFSPEEANRVAEVLGQWINSSSSPYESEDDFFTHFLHAGHQTSIFLQMLRPFTTCHDVTTFHDPHDLLKNFPVFISLHLCCEYATLYALISSRFPFGCSNLVVVYTLATRLLSCLHNPYMVFL